MRAPIGPILVLLGLATTVVLVLLLVQASGVRSDLDRTRADVATLRASVDAQQAPITPDELRTELDALEADIAALLLVQPGTSSGDPSQPAGGASDVEAKLDEVLARIEALDRRVTEICENVPVC